jgi:hypothetical protein
MEMKFTLVTDIFFLQIEKSMAIHIDTKEHKD